MTSAALAQVLALAAALCVCGVGIALAIGAGNFVKQGGGLALAHIGAALACVALGAPSLAVGLCVSLAAVSGLAAAIAARIAEIYHVSEMADAATSDAAGEGASS